MESRPELPDFGERVAEVVRRCLAPYGQDTADMEIVWSAKAGMHFIEVKPRTPGAAAVSIGLMSDELWVRTGATRFEIWRSKRRPDPLDALDAVLQAVFAGRLEEAGRGEDRFARIELLDGTVYRVGTAHLPIPWTRRRSRRYAPYGPQS